MKLDTDKVLTPAETRVASGYVSGMIGKEIASAAGISHNTVVRHTQNIYDKAGIPRSTNALVAWFLSENFHIDLAEFRRRVGAALLLALISVQTVCDGLLQRLRPQRQGAPGGSTQGTPAQRGRRQHTRHHKHLITHANLWE